MADHFSLAQHLQEAATKYLAAPALLNGESIWSFGELLAQSHALAEDIEQSLQPLIKSAPPFQLARYAYASSLKNRPYWPLAPSASLSFNSPGSSSSISRCSIPSPDAIPALPGAALIISTSGSEGRPRAVLLGNAQLDVAAAASNKRLPLGPGDLWLNCLPLYHIGGQAILWRCARAAAGVLLHAGFNADAVAIDLQRYPVTHISLVPAMLAQLVERKVKPPSSLRIALIGGAALSPSLYHQATSAGWPLYPSYGMSETSAQFATFMPSDGEWHEGLVGQP
ncbi:MAG: hypothetical protein ACD_10C00603G0002, partial [uncultured bacterium]